MKNKTLNKYWRIRIPLLCCLVIVATLSLSFFSEEEAKAQPDKISKLIAKLRNHVDYKVRLSAAVSLARIGNKRAVRAFIVALDDKNHTVRSVAAAGLGKIVEGSLKNDQNCSLDD